MDKREVNKQDVFITRRTNNAFVGEAFFYPPGEIIPRGKVFQSLRRLVVERATPREEVIL